MGYKLPIDEWEDINITPAERKALNSLSLNKDWDVLVEVMSRWHLSKAYELIRAPNTSQDFELIRKQGGLDSFRKMVEYVNGKED